MASWNNPELVRYARAELRPARMLTAALVMLAICFLIALSCWGAQTGKPRGSFELFYYWVLGSQFVLVGMWSGAACGQAISRERELKTWDFQKTTRLTAGELVFGKLVGAPVMGYFVAGVSLPLSLVAGLAAGFSPLVLLATLLLMAAFAMFTGLVALWCSMLMERSSGAAIGLLVVFLSVVVAAFVVSAWPGLAALSIMPAVLTLYGATPGGRPTAPLLGFPLHYGVLTPLLYAAFGAWLYLMLVRNLKRDREEFQLLSRWQAIGLVAFLNFLFYSLADVKNPAFPGVHRPADTFRDLGIAFNAMVLFTVGLFTLTPQEKLKVWWRRRAAGQATYFDPDGLPWPWLAVSAAIAYGMLLAASVILLRPAPSGEFRFGTAALKLLIVLLFITRDVLFLQWCLLTRLRRAIVAGLGYLLLYYTAVSIIAGVAGIFFEPLLPFLFGLLTPFSALSLEFNLFYAVGVYAGAALQLGILLLLLEAISRRLRRMAVAAAAVAA